MILPKTLIAIDFETADYKADSACAVGMVRLENNKGFFEIIDTFSSLIRPPRKEFIFTYIHGIAWEDVEFKEDFCAVWQKASSFLEGAEGFIAHNAPFDRKVLHTCCIEQRVIIPPQPFFCTLKNSRKFLKLPSHKLNKVAEYFDISLEHHEALSDAKASAQIFANLHNLGFNVWEGKCK